MKANKANHFVYRFDTSNTVLDMTTSKALKARAYNTKIKRNICGLPVEAQIASSNGYEIPDRSLLTCDTAVISFFLCYDLAIKWLKCQPEGWVVIRIQSRIIESSDWFTEYYVDGAMGCNGSIVYCPCKGISVGEAIINSSDIEQYLNNKWVKL